MFIAFPIPRDNAGNINDTMTKLVYYRERIRNEARLPLMDMKLYKDCEDDIAAACFSNTISIKYSMEKTISRMSSHRNNHYHDDVLAKHCGVMSNLLYATVNNDYTNHFVVSLNFFFQDVYDTLHAFYELITASTDPSDCGYEISDVLECMQTCIMFDHILTFLYTTLQFSDDSRLHKHLLDIEKVINIITDDPMDAFHVSNM